MWVSTTGIRALLDREHIMGLATDNATARAAGELAGADQWQSAGWILSDSPSDARLLWVEFPEARRAPTLTTVSLPDTWATCSCPATRFPCRHVIALLLRDLQGSIAPRSDAPEWAAVAGQSPAPDGRHEAGEREAAVVAGMAELRLWLGDLARDGLAGLPKRGRGAWQGAINRLEDAYALEAARELREMAALPGSGNDWPERLLPRLGRLALLAEAFRRLDELPAGERGDALAAAGHYPRSTSATVADDWIVVGRVTEVENRAIRWRTWLLGRATGRWARLDEACAAGDLRGVLLPTGAVAAGELAYLPSAYPLLAQAAAPLRVKPLDDDGFSHQETGIDAALRGYAAALASNPWLRRYPLALHGVWIEPPGPAGGRWRLRDREGRLLLLPPQFGHGWRLLALSADRPLSLFGEWDGATFTPASYFDGRWRAFTPWRPVP